MASISLATRSNANSYFIFVIATYVMCCSNFSVTNEILTNSQSKMRAQMYLGKGSFQGISFFRNQK